MKNYVNGIIGLVAVFLLLVTIDVSAIKNICGKCNERAELTDTICRQCKAPLNKCLECKFENPVSADYCLQCGEMLAEMRVLNTIDPELREELRLGQSDRAQLDREMARLTNLLEKEPAKAEIYLYRLAKIYKEMNFYSREAMAWKDYLEKYPNSPRLNRIKAFLSEALRQWGYLFFMQNEKDSAMKKFEEAVQANPMNSEAWLWVARMKNENNDKAGAAEGYLSALKARPGDKTAIHFLRSMKKSIPKELLKAGAPAGYSIAPSNDSTTVPAEPPAAPQGEPKPVEAVKE